ncbi:MAG: 3'(2'),5'-bisphosphate nucleotidase CysQ [Gammaproteobacteria bacterium]|nr:3'(2'),5'-bisphosphate nucleotidase CysQ [Gammaproteobacteria bacterium]
MSETPFELDKWLPEVCRIAYEAGCQISTLYHQNERLAVDMKGDGTPVTEADKQADEFISTALQALTPHIPLVTEESVADVPFETRSDWACYWLVDPLDGTKEFIERTGEFSVNIALIVNHEPVLGVVYGPEGGDCYFSIKGQPAYKLPGLIPIDKPFNWPVLIHQADTIKVNQITEWQGIKIAVSRRHGGMIQRYIAQLGHAELIHMGSALKTCLVAEGRADIYPRFGPTSLWDTAAAHCILNSAGGAVLNAAGHPLQYVQTASLLNPFFIAVCSEDAHWPAFPAVL